jgi:hypothetical protein
MTKDLDTRFPDYGCAREFFAWAKRKPAGFRDAMSADVLPECVWPLPFRTPRKAGIRRARRHRQQRHLQPGDRAAALADADAGA